MTGRRRVGKSTLIKRFGQKQADLDFFRVTGIPPQSDEGKKHEFNELANQI